MTQSIASRPVKTKSILFKVCVPKRTGRKRKRGTDAPYVEDPYYATKQTLAAEDVLKRLQDNPEKYQIEAVGHVNETHRFRAMSDFVNSPSGIPLINRRKSQSQPVNVEKMQDFENTRTKNALMSSARQLNLHSQPFNYFYRQNPTVRVKHDSITGQATLHNTQQFERLHIQPFPSNVPTIPSEMPASLPPLESLSQDMQSGIKKLRAFLETRPIITRRVGLNHLGRKYEHNFKSISQWCGFQFRSGPWRDTLVRYGVDPRTDPEYRKYQTIMFQLASPSMVNHSNVGRGGERSSAAVGAEKGFVGGGVDVSDGKWRWNRAPRLRPKDGENASHIFDGRRVWTDGKVWQACDIQAPLLRELLEKSPVRDECDLESDGWFANGSWSKLRVIMKDMISVLPNAQSQDSVAGEDQEGVPSEKDEAVWRDLAELMPDILDEKSLDMTYIAVKRKQSRLEELATQVRTIAKKGMGGKYREDTLEGSMFDAKRNAAVLVAKEMTADEERESETPTVSQTEATEDVDGAQNFPSIIPTIIGVDDGGETEEVEDEAEQTAFEDALMEQDNDDDLEGEGAR